MINQLNSKTFCSLVKIPEWNYPIKEAEIILCGIPLENTPTIRPGAKFGTFVRLAYIGVEPYFPDLDIDVLSDAKVCDLGDMYVPLGDSNLAVKTITKVIKNLKQQNKKAKILVIGGDHTISYPVVKALRPKSVISFDTHLDIHPEWLGVKYTHTSWSRWIKEEFGCELFFVGIGSYEKESWNYIKMNNIPIIPVEEIEFNFDNAFNVFKNQILSMTEPLYISIDMDCLKDIDDMEVKGAISLYQLQAMLNFIFKNKKVIGVDVCELCPDRILDRQSFVGLTLIYYIVALMTKYFKKFSY